MKTFILLSFLLMSVSYAGIDGPACYANGTIDPPIVLPEWPIEYTTIEKVDYERNHQASFCKRPVEMIDTIVLHHSETPSTTTPEEINQMHLDRSPTDPWYMIGYSYVINSSYAGDSQPSARVSEGRPLDLVGAHAGSNLFVGMDSVQKQLWDEGKIVCGQENEEFKVDPKIVQGNSISPNVTTIGLVVVGNYSPFSKANPNGYRAGKPRNPTKATLDLVARTSCQLQKKYPRMKYIKWHNYYHSTSCPGRLKLYINQIKQLTRRYGCEFQ